MTRLTGSGSAARSNGACPIEDYAVIGDCHGAALVSARGSIDWCCLRRFDNDPAFFALIDGTSGGTWRIDVPGARISRAYLHGTAILQTRFETDLGVSDFMPVGRRRTAGTHDYVSLNAPCWLIRRLEASGGPVDVTMHVTPRGPDFCTDPLPLTRRGEGVIGDGTAMLYCNGDATLGDGMLREYSSDDGEPSGSAGKPMLNVLQGEDLENCAVVVTRYYGGTNLGVGGLVRAYSRATKDAVAAAGVVEEAPHTRFVATVEYDDSGTVRGIVESAGVEFDAAYGSDVRFDVRVPVADADALADRLRSATNGRVDID